MERGDAQRAHQRQENRGQDDDCGGGLHKHARNQDDERNQEQDDVLIGGNAQHGGGDGFRNLPVGQRPAERAAARDDNHDDGAGFGRAEHGGIELFEAHIAIDERGNQQRVDDGHGRRFGRGEVAGEDAAEDDRGHQNAGDGLEEGLAHIFEGERRALGIVVFIRLIERYGDEHQTHDDARHETGAEQAADAFLRDDGVEHHRHGRRNNHADGAGGGDERGGGILAIAALFQFRHERRADGGSGGRARTGDRGEEHARQHGDHGQAALDHAQQGFAELDEHFGNFTAREQIARKDEKRHGNQAEGIAAGEHALHHDHHLGGAEARKHRRRGGGTDGERDRHAQQQKGDKHAEQNQCH